MNKAHFIFMQKIFLTTMMVVLMVGCGTKRILSDKQTSTPSNQSIGIEQIVDNCKTQRSVIKFVDIKNAEAVFEQGGNSYNIRLAVKVIKDREICISVLPILGIEMYQIRFTPERFYLFDKFHKKYCSGSYEYISALTKTKISYRKIEALLCNDIFSLSADDDVAKEYVAKQLVDKFVLVSKDKEMGYRHLFDISPDYMATKTAIVKEHKEVLNIDYSMFSLVNRVVFPTVINIKSDMENLFFYLKINIDKIQINKPFKLGGLNLKRYTKSDCEFMF